MEDSAGCHRCLLRLSRRRAINPGEHRQPDNMDLYASTGYSVTCCGQDSCHHPAVFIVWGLITQGHLYKKKLCGAWVTGLMVLKEVTAWEMRNSVTWSCVFHKHMCTTKKLRDQQTREQ